MRAKILQTALLIELAVAGTPVHAKQVTSALIRTANTLLTLPSQEKPILLIRPQLGPNADGENYFYLYFSVNSCRSVDNPGNVYPISSSEGIGRGTNLAAYYCNGRLVSYSGGMDYQQFKATAALGKFRIKDGGGRFIEPFQESTILKFSSPDAANEFVHKWEDQIELTTLRAQSLNNNSIANKARMATFAGAPTQLDIIKAFARAQAQFNPSAALTATPGETAISMSIFGAIGYFRRSVSDISCIRPKSGHYSCNFVLNIEMVPANDFMALTLITVPKKNSTKWTANFYKVADFWRSNDIEEGAKRAAADSSSQNSNDDDWRQKLNDDERKQRFNNCIRDMERFIPCPY